MDVYDRPYVFQGPLRKERYLGSIISHCKGFLCEVVCYTHERNLEELELLKKENNLDNLTIKVKELNEVKYSAEIRRIENIKTKEELINLGGRPPEVLWGKFDFLKEEATDDVDFIYWIDAGLQSNQIFPLKYHPEISENIKNIDDLPHEVMYTKYRQYNFTKIFNKKLFEKLETKSANKIVVLLATNVPQCSYYNFEEYSHSPTEYPIAGFFGGDVKIVREFCDKFTEGANLYFKYDTLGFEQSVMKYVTDLFSQEKLLKYFFETHQGGIPVNFFHFEKWTEDCGFQKPIYVIWEEILDIR